MISIMVGYGIPAFAYASGIDEWLDLSVEVTDTVVALSESTPLAVAGAQFGRAWVAVQRGEVETAAEYREPLLNLKSTVGNGWFNTPSLPTIDRLLGQIAITQRDFERSFFHFEQALAFSQNAGFRPEEAWTCHDFASALLQRNRTGDRQRADSLLTDCTEIADAIGMASLTARAAELRSQSLSEAVPARPPDGLTERELEVLNLIAAGNSNSEIADELVVSINTVLHHVTNILGKTGSRNRTEAAMFAAQKNLFSADD